MAKYRVIANSVNIHAGVLGLEPHQARARLHRVMYLGGNRDARDGVPLGGTGMNRYEIVDPPVSFKRGEEFEYEGELPKHLVESVMSCPVLTVGKPPYHPTFPVIDAELVPDESEAVTEKSEAVTEKSEAVTDDGVVAKKPHNRKKGSRGAKPAA